MPTSLTFDQHLAVVRRAGEDLAVVAEQAGLSARVPACPAWDVRALLAHQTTVHRWATAVVGKGDEQALQSQTWVRRHRPDIVAYYREGLATLLATLAVAPDDLEVMTFLADVATPKRFWARRQAHELTMHLLDGRGALLRRRATVAEAGIDAAFAVDGLDELLRGFYSRGRCKLFEGTEYTVVLRATDVGQHWVVRVGERFVVEPDGTPVPPRAEVSLSGTAAALYTGLWNRTDELEVTGDPGFLDQWRATNRVKWS